MISMRKILFSLLLAVLGAFAASGAGERDVTLAEGQTLKFFPARALMTGAVLETGADCVELQRVGALVILRGLKAGEATARIALRGGGEAFLCEEAAEYVAACGVKAILTDAVSVGPADNEAMIHTILMRGGVAIVENVTLDAVADGDYLLFAFPMKLGGADGAPVRAVLVGPDE